MDSSAALQQARLPKSSQGFADWRPDIQGLRGIAAILVVLYHARFSQFGGGYVGVDVFFVISGYVITRQILLLSARGQFGVGSFLLRRAQRLVPAATAMIAATTIAAIAILTPVDLVGFAKSSLAVLAWTGNFFFWRQQGYFAASVPESPLLHMWSLGVEAQFYLMYPLLLLALFRLGPRQRVKVLWSLALLSFALGVWGSHYHPGGAFYLLPTRAWEFLVGALLVMSGGVSWGSPRVRAALAVAGVGAVGFCALCLSSQTPYPGVAVVLPVIATAALILFSPSTPVAGLLGTSSIVAIGAASYSLYLWHWPVLVLLRYQFGPNPAPMSLAGALAVIALLTYVSWRFVEEPFRAGGFDRVSRRTAAVWLAVAGCAGAALLLIRLDGMHGRFPGEALVFDSQRVLQHPGARPCHEVDAHIVGQEYLCRLSAPRESKGRAIIWGDSHANALVPGVSSLAAEKGMDLWQATYSSCPPMLGVDVARMPATHRCREFNDAVLSAIRTLNIRHVLLAAYWSAYLPDPGPSLVDRWLDPFSATDALGAQDVNSNQLNFSAGMDRTIAALESAGVEVWIVKEVPTHQEFVPLALVRAILGTGSVTTVYLPLSMHERRVGRSEAVLSRVVSRDHLIDTTPILCPLGRCIAGLSNVSLYVDSNHLSESGARMLSPSLAKAFD